MLTLLLLVLSGANADIIKSPVTYMDGETPLEGYLVYDDTKPKAPTVIIFHDWDGLNDYEMKRAEQIAALGYVAFCADVYGKGVRPRTLQQNMAESAKYKDDRKLFRQRVNAALAFIRSHPRVDSTKIAAIGYCFGGTAVLELARSGADVRGVVSFHGGLDSPTPQDAKDIRTKILVLHGADDPLVPPKDVEAFHQEMRSAAVDYIFIAYGGAVHSFTQPFAGANRTSGAAYDANADRRSWEAMKLFLKEVLGS